MLANQVRREKKRWKEYEGKDQKREEREKILTYLSMIERQN